MTPKPSEPPPPVKDNVIVVNDGLNTIITWLVIALIVLVVASYQTFRPFQQFVDGHWPLLGAGLLVLIVAAAFFARVRGRLQNISVRTRVALTIVALLAIVTLIVYGITKLPQSHQGVALRILLLAPACLFPATLYYLFISTRKYIVLNEFIINLDRLGLLDRRSANPPESDVVRKLRFRAYLQKFEAVYGSLPNDLIEGLIASDDPRSILVT
jgi:hypothetical protein